MSVISDMAKFARLHVSSGDIDPAYPVLRELVAGFSPEDAVACALSYVAFYDLSSAIRFWIGEDAADLPCATERRGLRGGVVDRHLDALKEQRELHGSFTSWLQNGWVGPHSSPEHRWAVTFNNVQQAWGNGRWAAYKTCEILSTVLHWPMTAPDAGHAWSSGPRKGLALVFGAREGNTKGVVDLLNLQTEALRLEIAMDGGPLLPVEQLETVLCDFYSMSQGHYYVGHDIDQQLEQAMRPSTPDTVRHMLAVSRLKSFPHEYLGELNGWDGVDKSRCSVYRNTGLIISRSSS